MAGPPASTWSVTSVPGGQHSTPEDQAELTKLFDLGWEPFAVTPQGMGWVYHLRGQF